MAEIAVLDSKTIDHIAAGEVVERPASVVKELVENACDAGATAVTVEIKDGGTTFIRVTDNGSGIEKSQVQKAFLRHATSKIRNVEDLTCIRSMGFRGEALSSISAVGMVEMITKTRDALTGVRYCIEGERERDFAEVGAPDGTTIIIRDLFFNTPARRKFLKTPATEGGYVADLMEHMALARPDVSFQFLINRQTRFSTSGSGDLKEVVYRIYGREIAKEIFPFCAEENGIKVEGLLGTPQLVRPNRNFEFFFVNNRYIKSQILSKGLENGYQSWLMQHKFPMAFLHFTIDTENVDVNVHPSKMEVRFSDNQQIFDFLSRRVQEALHGREMIPAVTLSEEKTKPAEAAPAPENTQEKTLAQETKTAQMEAQKLAQQLLSMPRPTAGSGQEQRRMSDTVQRTAAPEGSPSGQPAQPQQQQKSLPPQPKRLPPQPFEKKRLEAMVKEERLEYETKAPEIANAKQMDLFEERILSRKAVQQYQIIGQIFDTYWIASYQDKMILIDQHAAHEKVKYEVLMKKLREGKADSQNLMPPVIVTLSNPEAELLKRYQEYFLQIGFEIEPFGGNSYAIRSVPCDLYGNLSGELLQEILNELVSEQKPGTPQAVSERIATMACKSAVKGNHRMDKAEMEELLEQLLALDNPYHCPHGRPTMITMTKQELEKKFKRIV
ncbi:MAG: DNA mismatch repair endonuclease MutL [Eubacteriales bacterium]|nr:DNA mismatch repair endonuclease MutL [Eubacteriales bacterium]